MTGALILLPSFTLSQCTVSAAVIALNPCEALPRAWLEHRAAARAVRAAPPAEALHPRTVLQSENALARVAVPLAPAPPVLYRRAGAAPLAEAARCVPQAAANAPVDAFQETNASQANVQHPARAREAPRPCALARLRSNAWEVHRGAICRAAFRPARLLAVAGRDWARALMGVDGGSCGEPIRHAARTRDGCDNDCPNRHPARK